MYVDWKKKRMMTNIPTYPVKSHKRGWLLLLWRSTIKSNQIQAMNHFSRKSTRNKITTFSILITTFRDALRTAWGCRTGNSGLWKWFRNMGCHSADLNRDRPRNCRTTTPTPRRLKTPFLRLVVVTLRMYGSSLYMCDIIFTRNWYFPKIKCVRLFYVATVLLQ